MGAVAAVLMWCGWLCGLCALLMWWKAERHRVAVRAPLLPATPGRVRAGPERLPGWLVRMAEPLAARGASLSLGGDLDRWERQLILAGRPYALTAPLFAGLRLVLVADGLLGGNLLSLLGLPFLTPVVLAAAGYFGPAIWLREKAGQRQRRIGAALPDFLDTVACSLESGGLGLEQALARAAAYFPGPLAEELGRFQQELELGVSRADALSRLLQRTDCRELELLVQALLQAESIGAPVAQAFLIQAESIRNLRAQHAREAASRAEARLTAVGTLVLAPISLLFILALLGLNLFYNPAFSGFRSLW